MSAEEIKNSFNPLQSKLWNPDTDSKGNLTKDSLTQIDVEIQKLMKSGILNEEQSKDLGSIHNDFLKTISIKENESNPVNVKDLGPISNRVQQIRTKLLEGKEVNMGVLERIKGGPALNIMRTMQTSKGVAQTKPVSKEMKVNAEKEEVARKQEPLLKCLLAALLNKYTNEKEIWIFMNPNVEDPEVEKLLKEAGIDKNQTAQLNVRKLVHLINTNENCQKTDKIILPQLSFSEISFLKDLDIRLPNLKTVLGSQRDHSVNDYYPDFPKIADKLPQWYSDKLSRRKRPTHRTRGNPGV